MLVKISFETEISEDKINELIEELALKYDEINWEKLE